jgi:transposase
MRTRTFWLSESEEGAFGQGEAETRNVYELKRLQAVGLYGRGSSLEHMTDMLGSSERSILRWVSDYQRDGLSGLQPGWDGQNANKLSTAQRAEVKRKVEQYRPDQVLPSEIRVSQGEFWTVSDMQVAVKRWFGVEYRCEDSYRTLLVEAGLSYQRAEGVYRSKPSQIAIADFEAELEKK